MSESIDLDGGEPCLVHHDLYWNPVNFRQRWGRICRVSSGFAAAADDDVFVPCLGYAGPRRLLDTLKKRRKFVEAIERRQPDELKRLLAAPKPSTTI